MLLKLCAVGPFVSFLDHLARPQQVLFLHYSRIRWGDWHLVPSAAAIFASVGFLRALFVILAPCPPLFEEEGGARRQALAVDLVNPFFFDRSSRFTAFSADDRPMDVAEVDGANRSNPRLKGNEPDGRRHLTEMVDTAHDIRVFNAGREP